MHQRKTYLAYGSNINQRQMAQRCPFAKVLGTGFVEGQELEFKGVATISPNENAVTPVLAWTIAPSDESSLDIFEGYPSMYIKKSFDVKINGEKMTGMAYVMNKLRPQYIPTRSYYECIAEGYRCAGMDMSYLKNALKRAKLEQEARNTFYIAYGSNINQKQMSVRCPDSVTVAKAKLPGYELYLTHIAKE